MSRKKDKRISENTMQVYCRGCWLVFFVPFYIYCFRGYAPLCPDCVTKAKENGTFKPIRLPRLTLLEDPSNKK